ncbi:MAG: ABC transporter permease subunit [Chloroflexaceae bacterium]|nr:ABC transporter permease subunit [Chloroflexaceae bacterium]
MIHHSARISWLALPMLALLCLPILGLIGQSTPTAIWQALASPTLHQAVWLSIGTCAATLGVTLIFGTPLAIWLAHSRHPWLAICVDLPTVLPPAVAGLALLSIFGRTGWIGQLGLPLSFTTTAVVLAQLFVAAPLYIQATVVALRAIDDDIIAAAHIDGADTAQQWRYIIIPLARTGMFTGAALALARALGEFGATALFAGSLPGRTRTMALAIYVAAESDDATAITMSLILLGMSLVILLFIRRRDS